MMLSLLCAPSTKQRGNQDTSLLLLEPSSVLCPSQNNKDLICRRGKKVSAKNGIASLSANGTKSRSTPEILFCHEKGARSGKSKSCSDLFKLLRRRKPPLCNEIDAIETSQIKILEKHESNGHLREFPADFVVRCKTSIARNSRLKLDEDIKNLPYCRRETDLRPQDQDESLYMAAFHEIDDDCTRHGRRPSCSLDDDNWRDNRRPAEKELKQVERFPCPYDRYSHRNDEAQENIAAYGKGGQNRLKYQTVESALHPHSNNLLKQDTVIQPRSQHFVQFSTLSIREYTVVEGNHPFCREAPALELGWDMAYEISNIPIHVFELLRQVELDEEDALQLKALGFEYETMRMPRRRTRKELRLDLSTRRRWLGLLYDIYEKNLGLCMHA